jgi:hypothetical protein
MSQPSIQWTGNAADPLFPDIKQESYTDTLPEDLFQQNACEESFFLSTNDVFDDFAFPSGGASLDCTGLTTASTPNFSSYSFTTGSSALNTTGTPFPHHQQTYQYPNRPLLFRAHTNNTPFAQHSQGYDRRRSLSHSDVDRITVHPTFVRLQGLHSSRSTTPEDKASGSARHVRSVSQGPTYLGRPLKNAVPYALSRSSLVSGTRIGTPIGPNDERGSRKRVRYPRCQDDDEDDDEEVQVRHVTDALHLAHSRRVIEIGAMAVRNHACPADDGEAEGCMTPHERILKKLADVELYLQQHEQENEDALKGCEMIKEALGRRSGLLGYEDTPVDDGLEMPSEMMPKDGMGLFGVCFGEEDLMGFLATENKRLRCDD